MKPLFSQKLSNFLLKLGNKILYKLRRRIVYEAILAG